MARFDMTAGNIGVCRPDCRHYHFGAYLVNVKTGLVQVYIYLSLLTSAYNYSCNPVKSLNPGGQSLLKVGFQLRCAAHPGYPVEDHRHLGDIKLENHRIFNPFRHILAYTADIFPDVLTRKIKVCSPVKCSSYYRHSFG